jgi:uncharacterized repeat protein (TIGR02543 family)
MKNFICFFFLPLILCSFDYPEYSAEKFIAHAGGAIEGYTYTNSLEALNLSYSKGCKLFELDIIETSDSKLVAAHHWASYKSIVSHPNSTDEPISEAEFMSYKIYDYLSPLSEQDIRSWFDEHKDAILITDKINSPQKIAQKFSSFKDRIIMELFSWAAVEEAIGVGVIPMPSDNLVFGTPNVEAKILDMNIKYIALSRRLIDNNKEFLRRLKELGIKAYVFHVNFDTGKDEKWVLENELDYCYGLYADKLDLLQSIEGSAFFNCNGLDSVTISEGVTSIGSSAFFNCSDLTSVTVDTANPSYSSQDGVLFNKDKTTLIYYPTGKTGGYTIPSSVTSIRSSAFSYCGGLTSVIIPSSVTEIGREAFFGCSGLTSATIPSSVTSIGSSAFSGCSGLNSVTIPASVTSIGSWTFSNCSKLAHIYAQLDTPPTVGSSDAFYNVPTSTCTLHVPSGSKRLYEVADIWKDFSNIVKDLYTVTFSSDGGSSIAPLTDVAHNATINAPAAPAKTGYAFVGWYREEACSNPWSFDSDTITQDTTLYAKWSINTYTVSFNSDGGSSVAPLTDVVYNATINAPAAPAKTGYAFVGWYREEACSNPWSFDSDTITQDTTLYAKWTKDATGVKAQLQLNVTLYPNPFASSVRLAGAAGCTLTVITAAGAPVHTQKVSSADETIRLEHLPAGLYLFRLEKDGKTYTVKGYKY